MIDLSSARHLAASEATLAVGALVLLMVGAFAGDKSTRLVSLLSVLLLASCGGNTRPEPPPAAAPADDAEILQRPHMLRHGAQHPAIAELGLVEPPGLVVADGMAERLGQGAGEAAATGRRGHSSRQSLLQKTRGQPAL